MLEFLSDFIYMIPIIVIVSIAFAAIISLKGFLQDSDRPIFQFIYSVLKALLIIALLVCIVIAFFLPDKEANANPVENVVCVIKSNEY